jgi:two-component sensor histidine kinase
LCSDDRSKNLAQVDLSAYLNQLCTQLFRALVARPGAIKLHMDLNTVHLSIDQAIPCGLLVNELVTNAFKHAFPEGHTGDVRIELQPMEDANSLRLRVSDNGVGLPKEFDIKNLTSLGLSLVSDLARQIGSLLVIGPGPGAAFEIVFKAK